MALFGEILNAFEGSVFKWNQMYYPFGFTSNIKSFLGAGTYKIKAQYNPPYYADERIARPNGTAESNIFKIKIL